MNVWMNLIVVNILPCIDIPSHHIIHLTYIIFVTFTSVKLGGKMKEISTAKKKKSSVESEERSSSTPAHLTLTPCPPSLGWDVWAAEKFVPSMTTTGLPSGQEVLATLSGTWQQQCGRARKWQFLKAWRISDYKRRLVWTRAELPWARNHTDLGTWGLAKTLQKETSPHYDNAEQRPCGPGGALSPERWWNDGGWPTRHCYWKRG